MAERTPPRILVVDGANVVGTRPDGWWRDRAGAAARLHAQLTGADLPFAVIVLVLEGQDKAGTPEGVTGAVRVVHADGLGDDELVAQCRGLCDAGDVTLVTADRELIARVSHVASVIRPRALLDALPSA